MENQEHIDLQNDMVDSQEHMQHQNGVMENQGDMPHQNNIMDSQGYMQIQNGIMQSHTGTEHQDDVMESHSNMEHCNVVMESQGHMQHQNDVMENHTGLEHQNDMMESHRNLEHYENDDGEEDESDNHAYETDDDSEVYSEFEVEDDDVALNIFAPPPATRETIESIPFLKITQQHVEDGTNCNVCFEEYFVDEAVNILPCLHMFHSYCIIEWLSMHNSCPLCRTSLDEQASNEHGDDVPSSSNDYLSASAADW